MAITSITFTIPVHQKLTMDAAKLAEFCEEHGLDIPPDGDFIKDDPDLIRALEGHIEEVGNSYSGELEVSDWS